MNTITTINPKIITEVNKIFGRQAIVSSIDYMLVDGEARTFLIKEKLC